MNCGIGRRCGLELALLWLWHRPAATALIRPLAWEPPYAMGVVLKKKKKKLNKSNYKKVHDALKKKILNGEELLKDKHKNKGRLWSLKEKIGDLI